MKLASKGIRKGGNIGELNQNLGMHYRWGNKALLNKNVRINKGGNTAWLILLKGITKEGIKPS